MVLGCTFNRGVHLTDGHGKANGHAKKECGTNGVVTCEKCLHKYIVIRSRDTHAAPCKEFETSPCY
jgi:hypothetical protein